MLFKRTIEHKVDRALRKLPRYSASNKGLRYEKQVYSYRAVVDGDCIYIKLYYLGDIDHLSIDSLFAYASTMLDKFGYLFQGIARYDLNHELCLTFKKG